MPMVVGIPRETKEGENRVSLTPRGAGVLRAAGARVIVEAGAGERSGFPDSAYAGAGATVAGDPSKAWEADLVVR